jgi:hypothetical protein
MPVSMHSKAVKYLRILFQMLAWIVTRPHSTKLGLERLRAIFSKLKSEAGLIRFPVLCENNSVAQRELMLELTTWLAVPPGSTFVIDGH